MQENYKSDKEGEGGNKPLANEDSDPVGEPNKESAKGQNDVAVDKRPHWADRIIAIFTVLIFLTYITSDYFLWKQLKLTADTLKLTRNNFILDQRAWLGPTETIPPQFTNGSSRVFLKARSQSIFGVVLQNAGKTPAKEVVQQISFRTLPAGTRFTPRYPGQPQHAGVIQPGLRIQMLTPKTETLTDPNIEVYRNGQKILYLYGSITYKDVFEGTPLHHTTFCMYLLKDLSGFTDCDTYNGID